MCIPLLYLPARNVPYSSPMLLLSLLPEMENTENLTGQSLKVFTEHFVQGRGRNVLVASVLSPSLDLTVRSGGRSVHGTWRRSLICMFIASNKGQDVHLCS